LEPHVRQNQHALVETRAKGVRDTASRCGAYPKSVVDDCARRYDDQLRIRFRLTNAVAGKIVSLFEPHSEIIRRSKPAQFGKLAQVREAENQIIAHYDVFDHRSHDHELPGT
jgi:hypothetical protein